MEGDRGGSPGEKETGGAREAEVGGWKVGFLRWRGVGEIATLCNILQLKKAYRGGKPAKIGWELRLKCTGSGKYWGWGLSHESDVSAFSWF